MLILRILNNEMVFVRIRAMRQIFAEIVPAQYAKENYNFHLRLNHSYFDLISVCVLLLSMNFS